METTIDLFQAIAGEPGMGEPKDQNRIQPVDPQHITGKTGCLLGQVRAKFGFVPNFFRVLADAPVALEGYLNFSEALAGGTLDGRIRERIALAVAESNLCDYCLSAHAFLGQRAGLTPDEIANAIRARAADPKTDAILKLARNIVVQRGEISDSDLQQVRAAGLRDGEILETVANVALNIFMNYVSHAARLPIDFPPDELRQKSTQRGESDAQRREV
jgi:uncharacterized peroxidase-related enzyme